MYPSPPLPGIRKLLPLDIVGEEAIRNHGPPCMAGDAHTCCRVLNFCSCQANMNCFRLVHGAANQNWPSDLLTRTLTFSPMDASAATCVGIYHGPAGVKICCQIAIIFKIRQRASLACDCCLEHCAYAKSLASCPTYVRTPHSVMCSG